MTWTDDPPREEGYFWYFEREFDILDVVRVYYDAGRQVFLASGSMIESRRVGEMNGLWAGPIVPPDIEGGKRSERRSARGVGAPSRKK